MELLSAELVARCDVGGGLVLVEIEPAASMVSSYVHPGQVVKLVAEGHTSYFALAGRPGATRWKLLVRDAGGISRALVTAPLGARFTMSAASYAGMPYAQVDQGPFAIAVVGSALGAVRGLLHAVAEDGKAGRTTLYFGIRTHEALPLEQELAAFAAGGMRVVLCLSDVSTADPRPPFEARVGLVQGAITADHVGGLLPPGTRLYVAGPSAMMAELRALGPELSLEVLTNG